MTWVDVNNTDEPPDFQLVPNCGSVAAVAVASEISSADGTAIGGKTQRDFERIMRLEITLGGITLVNIGKDKDGDKACPCLHTTPCSPDCTCVKPFSFRGCSRCCSYGSKEQRRLTAEHLAKKIDPSV
jgi:hypothetical protein